jgi:hypothetical protein
MPLFYHVLDQRGHRVGGERGEAGSVVLPPLAAQPEAHAHEREPGRGEQRDVVY